MTSKLIPDPPHTFEESLLRMSDLLRCAAAVSYEAGEQQKGTNRDLPFAAVYLLDLAKAHANDMLNQLHESRAT